MPPFTWPIDHHSLVSAFEKQHSCPQAGALLMWAAYAVDTLHYLHDIDRGCDANPGFAGHMQDTIDIAHARWATSTCVTALDLCAAALGRAKCGNTKKRECDLRDFDPFPSSNAARSLQRRASLSTAALAWIDGTLSCPEFELVEAARHALVHSRVARHFTLAVGRPHVRLKVEVGAARIPVGEIVDTAVCCATRRITDFLGLLPSM